MGFKSGKVQVPSDATEGRWMVLPAGAGAARLQAGRGNETKYGFLFFLFEEKSK